MTGEIDSVLRTVNRAGEKSNKNTAVPLCCRFLVCFDGDDSEHQVPLKKCKKEPAFKKNKILNQFQLNYDY